MTDPVLSNSTQFPLNLDSQKQYTRGNIDNQITVIQPDSPEIIDRYTQFWLDQQKTKLHISALNPRLTNEDAFHQASESQIALGGLSLLPVSKGAEVFLARQGIQLINPSAPGLWTRPFISRNILQRTLINPVSEEVIKRSALQTGGRLGITLARQPLTRATAGATARFALQGGARAAFIAAGVGSGGALILTAVVFMAGEYVLVNYVIPEINRLMDDSQISFQYQDIKDENKDISSQRLIKNTYKDEMGAGHGQCTIVDLKDGVFTIGSSKKIDGEYTLHMWDQEERDLDIKPRAFDQAMRSIDGQFGNLAVMHLSFQDEEGNTITQEIPLEKFLGTEKKVLNPNYQIFGAMELANVMRAKNSPEASEKAMEMATRHLLETKDKLVTLPLDENFHETASLYKMYLDLYKEGLRQYRINRNEWQDSEKMTELEDAISAGEQYLKTYHQNFPDTLLGLTEQVKEIQNQANGPWNPQLTPEQLNAILNYIEQNKTANPALTETVRIIPDQGIMMNQFGIETLFQDSHARRNSSAVSLFETALKHRHSPTNDAWARFAVESSELHGLPSNQDLPTEINFRLLELKVRDLKDEMQKKEKLVQNLESLLRSNTTLAPSNYQDQIKNYVSLKLLEHIKQKPSFLEILSAEQDPKLQESLIKEFLDKISAETFQNSDIKQLQNIPANASQEQITSFYKMAFDEILSRLENR